jgi:HlyD family secretion protein
MKLPGVFRKWWFWVAAVIVLGGLFMVLKGPDEEVSYLTEMVEREDLLQTVDANGEVVSIDEVELSFDLSGTVEEILVSIGQEVRVGESLLKLNATELLADVRSAWQAVQVAQGNLDAQRAGSSDETVAVSARGLDIAKASLAAAEIDYANKQELIAVITDQYDAELIASEAALQSATDDLEQTVDDNANDLEAAYDDLLSAAWAGIIEVRSSVAKADEVLGEQNGTMNDDYELLFGSANPDAEDAARLMYGTAADSRDAAEEALIDTNYGDADTIADTAELVEEAMDDAAELLLHVREALDGTPVAGDLSLTELQSLLSSVDTTRAALQLDQAALQNAFQAVSSTVVSVSGALSDATNALTQAQANYDATVAARAYQVATAEDAFETAEANLATREAEVAQAEASLAQVAADPRDVDLASYEAEVSRAMAAYSAAEARLAKAEITSPIVGSVTDITVEEGEQVSLGGTVVVVQTTMEQFEIIADVSESDIAKVSVGDEAEIRFDAFGSGFEVIGQVRDIDPAEKMIESVVYYEVTVQLMDEDLLDSLRPGLSADLILTTDKRENVLSVPQRALFEKEGLDYVRVMDRRGNPEDRHVEVGIRGDLGRVEILSGLEEGDEVIIREISE